MESTNVISSIQKSINDADKNKYIKAYDQQPPRKRSTLHTTTYIAETSYFFWMRYKSNVTLQLQKFLVYIQESCFKFK